MPALSLSTIEDVILGFFADSQVDRAEGELPFDDIRGEWKRLKLRDSDLKEGLQSLIEAGICRLSRSDDGAAVQLTGIGAEYLQSSTLMGIKFMVTRRTLRWNVERLRGSVARQKAAYVLEGLERRQTLAAAPA